MISANEAYEVIFKETAPLGQEEVPLPEARGRFLSSPIFAPIDLPPFDNAAMDGYAVVSRDTERGFPASPIRLKVVACLAAGTSQKLPLLRSGEAVRLMTGAPMPEGADAVVPFEEASDENGFCRIAGKVSRGSDVRVKGEDVQKGQRVLEKGQLITPRTIALLAALGISKVSVFKKPRVALIVTGDELVEVGRSLSPGKIYNSNGPALVAALQELGIDPETVTIVPDSEEDLRGEFLKNLDSDLLITVGGVSAGDYDLIPKVLKELGAKIIFHKVSIKPGKPLLFATLVRAYLDTPLLVFSLPGNPVSALMVFDRFVRPALLKMIGSRNPLRLRRSAIAEAELHGSQGKEVYLRGIVEYREGKYFARSAGPQGSAHLLPLAEANAVLVIPAEKGTIRPMESLKFEFLGER
ncbi:MAG: molybdopterin molybdotransferase MoeA [Deltaproteobacteria bacterium]|nr:molybdopterin molybdotransferase MoeA [Deltaproteobacteria bacterium]